MKSKFRLLFLLLLLLSPMVKAQDIMGFNTGNYAGISGIDINPASIADSRYKFDFGMGAGFTFTNNYLGIGSKEIFNGNAFSGIGQGDKSVTTYSNNGMSVTETDANGNFVKNKLILQKDNSSADKMIYQNAYIQLPSFMVSLSKTTSIAFTWNIRELINVDNITPNLAEIAFYGNDPKNLKDIANQYWKIQLNNDKLAVNAMAWNEFGLGLGQVLINEGSNFLKAGIRVKMDWGLNSAYVYGNDLNYKWEDKTHLDLLQAQLGYGHSGGLNYGGANGQVFDIKTFTNMITHPGFVFDMGAIYEYRPGDKSVFTYNMDGETGIVRRDVNKYKWKIGASLVDVGVVPFTKQDPSNDFTANVTNLNTSDIKLDPTIPTIQAVDKLLKDSFAIKNTAKTYNMVLPAALSFQFDYHVYKGFYANLTTYTHPSFIYKNEEHLLHTLDYYSVTPRWESKWFGIYMPISVIQTGEFMFGTTLRLGPLVIGTSDISPWLGKEYIHGVDLHVGLKIPILWGKGPKDSDHDGVSDKKDKCPKEPGTWENHGCPPSKKVEEKKVPVVLDRDHDGVPDNLDSCPDVPGLAKLHGCPDRDHDGIPDYKDKCPDDSGLAIFDGCPDKDADGVPDKDDKCPSIPGSKLHHGCPDTDGDGVFDDEDQCPKVAGPASNHGCPEVDTDHDGVPDAIDKCPDVPGPKENNGCPWGDRDKDGVLDNVDQCPDVPGPVENHGCPWGDKDGDGVLDNVDQCPETPGPASNHGCPVLEKKVQRSLDSAVTGLQFETGKDVIKPISYKVLDKVADMLEKNPTYQLSLAGHTDNVGNAAANLELSRKRAEAVKKYVTDKGIPDNRIVVTYFGATRPIAPNTTEAGRAMNRRVAMKIIFK